MAGVVRWTFYDANTGVTTQYEVNPNEGGSPQRQKSVTTQPTTAPNGNTVLFEGEISPASFEWSGTLLSQDQYEMYLEWYRKRHQIQLTDDLGRQTWIYITDFDPVRVRSVLYPWKHTYSVKALEVNWP